MLKNFLIYFLILPYINFGQEASKSGIYEHFAKNKIKKVTEFKYNYHGLIACDSTPFKVQDFNEKGQLIKESFQGRGKLFAHYTFEYNNEGFLIDMDTMGMFSYSSTSSYTADTIYKTLITAETSMSFDTTSRLIEVISLSENDSLGYKKTIEYNQIGEISIEQFYTKNENLDFVKSISIQYLYNSMGLIEKIIWTNEQNVVDQITEYKYETFN